MTTENTETDKTREAAAPSRTRSRRPARGSGGSSAESSEAGACGGHLQPPSVTAEVPLKQRRPQRAGRRRGSRRADLASRRHRHLGTPGLQPVPAQGAFRSGTRGPAREAADAEAAEAILLAPEGLLILRRPRHNDRLQGRGARCRRYVSDMFKIEGRRKTGTCAKHQRALATAIKRARHIGLIPFSRTGALGQTVPRLDRGNRRRHGQNLRPVPTLAELSSGSTKKSPQPPFLFRGRQKTRVTLMRPAAGRRFKLVAAVAGVFVLVMAGILIGGVRRQVRSPSARGHGQGQRRRVHARRPGQAHDGYSSGAPSISVFRWRPPQRSSTCSRTLSSMRSWSSPPRSSA